MPDDAKAPLTPRQVAAWYLEKLTALRTSDPAADNLKDPKSVQDAEEFLIKIAGDANPNVVFAEMFSDAVSRTKRAIPIFLAFAKVLFPLAPKPAHWKQKKGFGIYSGIAFMDILAVLKLISEGCTQRKACAICKVDSYKISGYGVRMERKMVARPPVADTTEKARNKKRAIEAFRNGSGITFVSARKRWHLTVEEVRECREAAEKKRKALPRAPTLRPVNVGTLKRGW